MPPVLQRFWLVGPLVLAQVVVALELDLPVVQPLLALFSFVGLPTLLLYRRAGFASDSRTGRVIYAFGTSLLGLVVVALLLNLALPVVGIDHPLQPKVLALTWLVIDLALLAWRAEIPAVPARDWGSVPRRALEARIEPAQALAVGAVALAVVGAVRLNNGAGGSVALVAGLLAAGALLALMIRPEGTVGRDARCVALVATSLLLATSLRGWYITGHDIQAEYLAFQLTNGAQRWQMSSLENAYNACLSINILPTVLVQTTGLSGIFVFKVLLQLVFALVPVLTFLFSRRFLSRRLALVAATLTMAFPTFFTDMPYLVRQEIAFFFLALLLLAATEPSQTPAWRRPLVAVFGVGVVLSHYSTTYLMLMGLVFALAFMIIWTRVQRLRDQRDPDRKLSALVLLNPVIVLFLILVSLMWSGPITNTGGHAGDIAKETINALIGKGGDGPGSSDVSYRLFSGDDVTPRQRMDLFVKDSLAYREARIPAAEQLVRPLGRAQLRPEIVPNAQAPLTAVGRALDAAGLDPAKVSSAAKVACAAVMQVFLVLGLIWLVWRRKDDDPEEKPPPPEVAYLSFGAVAALALIVLVPNLSVDYGVLRAFQQTMLVVAPVMAAGMWMGLRLVLRRRAAAFAVVVPLGLLLVLSGVLPGLIGGHQARIAMQNSGIYYDRFYASDSEVQAISWLAEADRVGRSQSRIIANRNVNVRLLAATGNRAPVADRLFPTVLTKNSYVYVDGQTLKGRSTIFYTGDLLTYVYPLRDLDTRLNLVYSSPRSRIYR